MKKELIILLSISTSGYGATLQVSPSKDNTLYESATGTISNGGGTFTFIGKTGSNNGFKLRRTVTMFDVSAIPVGSTVSSVSVSFTISKSAIGAVAGPANLHLALTDWGESAVAAGSQGQGGPAQVNEATWLNTFFNTQAWTNAGGDYSPSSSATINYGTSDSEVIIFLSNNDLIADVQLWVDTPANNFGWVILGDEPTNQNARKLNSRESAAGTPVLTIEYIETIFASGFE